MALNRDSLRERTWQAVQAADAPTVRRWCQTAPRRSGTRRTTLDEAFYDGPEFSPRMLFSFRDSAK
ncbi:hypothetical protein RRG08_006080, partial [Elysia crispata]